MAKSLAELACVLGVRTPPAWAEIDILGLCEDTRSLRPGDLFTAIPGHDQDGSDYIVRAVSQGAAAVLTERFLELPVPVLKVDCARMALSRIAAAFYDHPTRDLFTVGVTGTNGKTTTCHWSADLLGSSETMLLSTVRNPISGISNLTTPPSPTIQRLARDAVDGGAGHLVLEASSAGIAQDRVSTIDFDVCVFTNLSSEHVQHHVGLAAYRSAKLKLFENLKPEAWAVLNADDPLHQTIAAATPARVFTYGIEAEADLRAVSVHCEARGSRFTVANGREEVEIAWLPLPGSHNISNALAAIGVGLARGIPLALLARRLAQVKPIPGRAQFFQRADGLVAVVDFAHNPRSLEAVLQSLRAGCSRIIAVFGCPGDGELEKRVGMGAVGSRWADAIVLTSDNPKNEDPRAIVDDIRSGIGGCPVPLTIQTDRRRAIEIAVSQAETGDIVLLAGKGHETEQVVGSERVPHSDAGVLRELGFVETV